MLSICCNQETEFREMTAGNIYFYLNIARIEILDILESGRDIEYEDLFKYHNIDDTHERLIKKYEQIELDMSHNDPRLNSDNGNIT